ncbi:phosphotransferase system mannose-type iia component [Trichococcus palustris]|uniref:phosphoenolpyruvate--glycerone phosphotransferase n=1 Tax=Trichococcus palustris TaxID=140314 RepID=A0A143Z0Q6_9LACT|nr:dihydroxyacetone kinase phosphoryl donor subunit DhaM [Trichococcus palustris]CZR01917.1 phosphotransferase system mannose-type iia component [Trichococcus palustris]SFL16369.1 dihydroxyacetone kinase, phosphotransfer subunit [Trichococcus palustris]
MMGKAYGILLVSHVAEIAEGIAKLTSQVAKDVTVISAGGTDTGGIGTSFDKLTAALNGMAEKEVLAFYDLGSSKMNLELAMENSDKHITIYDTAFVESAYTAAAMLQVDTPIEEIEEQMKKLIVK